MQTKEHLTLEQLEKDVWPEPDFLSHVVVTCHNLRKKRLAEFTHEDLRIMIGQSIGLDHLLPKALDILDKDPLAAGDFYDGDLLRAILRVADQITDKKAFKRLGAVCERALREDNGSLHRDDREIIEAFLSG